MANPREPRTSNQTQNPNPSRPRLFEFLEHHFDTDMPDRVDLRLVFGPGCKKVLNSAVRQWPYKPNSAKPTREALVGLSNEILALAQEDCNGTGRPQRYGVLLYNTRRSETHYARHIIPMRPTQEKVDDASSVGDDDDFDGDESSEKKSTLRALSEAHEHQRFMFQQFSEGIAGIIDRQEHRLEKQEDIIDRMYDKHLHMLESYEKILSRKHERDLAEKMQDFKIQTLAEGVSLVKGLLPVALNQMAGKELLPERSIESRTVETFVESLTDSEGVALFGKYDGETLVEEGIFSSAQAATFTGIATGDTPPEKIDEVVGSLTSEQYAAVQAAVPEAKLMPLIALYMQRKQKQQDSGGQ